MIDFREYNAPRTGSGDAYPAVQKAFDELPNGETLLMRGDLTLSRMPVLKDKQDVEVITSTVEPTVLRKGWAPVFSMCATWRIERCRNLRVEGIEVVGSAPPPLLPISTKWAAWNDDVLNLIDCHGVTLTRLHLHDCGDSLLRACGPGVTTDLEPSGVVATHLDVHHCQFHRGYQLSTTPSGLAGYSFCDNIVTGLVGSAKWSSRNDGAGRLRMERNTFEGIVDPSLATAAEPWKAYLNRQGLVELHGQKRVIMRTNTFRYSRNATAVTVRDTTDNVKVPVLWADVRIANDNTFEPSVMGGTFQVFTDTRSIVAGTM